MHESAKQINALWPVGTRVRVISNVEGIHYFPVPTEGVLMGETHNRYVRVAAVVGAQVQWVPPQDICLAEPDVEAEMWDE